MKQIKCIVFVYAKMCASFQELLCSLCLYHTYNNAESMSPPQLGMRGF